MKKLTIFLLFFCAMAQSFAANKYWVGATGANWTATSSWSNTPAPGSPGAAVPISTDDVYFETGALTANLTAAITVNSLTFTSSNVTFSGASAITTNTMTATTSVLIFSASVTVNTSLSLASTSTITTSGAASKSFKLGNGGAFALTGNSATNYFSGGGYFTFNTTSPLTVFFNGIIGGVEVTRGLITLGSSTNIQRLLLSATNSQELIIGEGNTLTLSSAGSSTLGSVANVGTVNASAAGSKFVMNSTNAGVLSAGTNRIFKDASTINSLEMNSTTKTFVLGFPLTVKDLILTAGTIDNTSNNITIATGGSITTTAGTITPNAVVYGLAAAPTSVVATADNAQASVAFTASVGNGGSAISTYTATSSPGGITASSATSPITVTGLTNGTPYTFTVKANNAVGASAASTASTAVTPAAVAGATVTPLTLTGFSYEYGSGPSSEQSFAVTGSGLSSDITITAPTHYEISTGTGGAFSATSPITISPSSGSVSSTIYVRLKAGYAPAAYNTENITVASTDFVTKNVVCSGSVVRTIATTIYVDGSMSDDNGNGLSWATAKKSITTASTLASVSGDVVFVKGGTYNLSKSTPSAAGVFSTNAGVSFYGSFAGAETTPSQRATSDIDGNGIVEPWEFTNQTVLNFTLTGSAAGFTTSNASAIVSNINGFKFTGTNTSSDFSSTDVRVTMRISKNVRFENNIVADWTVSGNLAGASAASLAAPFFDVTTAATYGNIAVHNCLFENNTITYTSTQSTLNSFHPFIAMGTAQAINRNVMLNCVVRNNRVTMDFSASTITGAETAAPRGLIVSILAPTVGYPTTLKNSIIHNNEVSFTPSATLLTAYGAPVYVYNSSNSSMSDSIINNTIAYNKTTNCNSAGIKFGMDLGGAAAPNHIIMNNVMYNNQNNGSISNFEANLAIPDASAMVKNNICNGGNFTTGGIIPFVNSNTNVADNLFDLSDTNNDATKGAFFSNPTTTIGYEANGTVELSRWIIGSGSYLKAKGITTLNTTDKSEFQFANPRSVGAYEYHQLAVSSGTTNISSLSNCPTCDLTVSGSGVELVVNQNTDLKSVTVSPGAKLTISSGTLTATNGITLESDENRTATILDSYSTPTITATVQQHVAAGRNWYLSSPVSAADYSWLSRGTSVQGWNEATKAWVLVTEGTLVKGKGYVQVATSSPSTTGTTGTVNVTGTTNSGDVAIIVSRTEDGSSRGFNLVGNPYPSYLKWTGENGFLADATNDSISTSFWYRTKSSSDAYVFTTYNGSSHLVVGGSTVNSVLNEYIPPMQAFWIRVNANEAVSTHNVGLTFKNNMRFHGVGDNNKFKAPKVDERKLVRLQLANGSQTDEALIYFDAAAANSFDNYDSPKMMNNSTTLPDLYTTAGSERLAINGLYEITDNMEHPLGFTLKTAVSGLKLKVSELNNFADGMKLYLLDKEQNSQTELFPATEYSFNTTASTTNNESRFSLLFRAPGVATGIDKTSKLNAQIFVNAANQITIIAPEKSNYAIYNAVGMMIEKGISASNTQTSNFKLQTGVYVVKVNNQSTRVIIK